MNAATHTQGIDSFITQLAGTSVQIREVKPGVWVAVPKDRAYIASKPWQALKAGPCQGIGQTPAEAAALLALAVGTAGPIKPTKQAAATHWLKIQLANGMVITTPWLRTQAEADGISMHALDRAARALGVKREKAGMDGPWLWFLA
jgi:hypothetical protein